MIGVVHVEDGPRLARQLSPGQRIVSKAGDLWRWDGFRASAGDQSAAALRLEQQNRLDALSRQLEIADQRMAAADDAQTLAAAHLREATAADQSARSNRRSAEETLATARRGLSQAEADVSMRAGRRDTVENALGRRAEDLADAETALREAIALSDEVGDPGAAETAAEEQRTFVAEARSAMLTARSAADALRREAEARTKRRQEVTKELSGWRHRLDTAEKRAEELTSRREKAQQDLTETRLAPDEIAETRSRAAARCPWRSQPARRGGRPGGSG
jgi:chromosome segregation protein